MPRHGDLLNRLSIRTRLIFLLLLIGSAIFCMVAIGSREIAQHADHRERVSLRDSSRFLAEKHQAQWEAVSDELTGLAATPFSYFECHAALLRLIHQSKAPIEMAGMLNTDGQIFCLARANSDATVQARWFTPAIVHRVLQSDKTITLYEEIGKKGRYIQILVRRVLLGERNSPSLVFAAIPADSMGGLLPKFNGHHLKVALFCPNGHIIDVFPRHPRQTLLTPGLTQHVWRIIRTASDNKPRDITVDDKMIGYTKIRHDLGYAVTITNLNNLYAPASLALWRTLAITLLILILTATFGWLLLVSPLVECAGALKRASEALASGNLDARTDVHRSCGELSHVAEAFNAMADNLAIRTRSAEKAARELAHVTRIQRIQAQVQRIPAETGEMEEFLETICATTTHDGEIAGTWIVSMANPDDVPNVLATSGLEEKFADCRNQPTCDPACSIRALLANALRQREVKSSTIPLAGIGGSHETTTVMVYPDRSTSSHYLVIFYFLEHSTFTCEYRGLVEELASEIHGRIMAADAIRKARYLETHDPVTGLLNRVTNVERLSRLLPEVLKGPDAIPCAVMIISFLNLGPIAEIDGQNVGDEIWSLIAGRLSALTALSGALLAQTRLGFFCTLFKLDSIHAVQREATSIANALTAPLTVSTGEVIHPEFRVGVAVAPRDGDDAELLLDRARQALANPSGDSVVFFSKAIDAQIHLEKRLEVALRNAMENEEIEFHYQPVVDSANGRVVGFETLARWPHGPDGKPVSPAQFIPIAERSHQIITLGNLALRTAVKQAEEWARLGYTGLRISLNVSPAQLQHPDFIKDAIEALNPNGHMLVSNRIAFEITESLLVDNTERNRGLLKQLNKLGFLLYLDDFGTGWSSLSYLHTLPFHTIKIDRSFVAPIANNRKIYGIARTIQACADMLQLDVIAEGVEDAVQLSLLRRMGCRYVQGYLTGRPVPADEATQLLSGDIQTSIRDTGTR